MNCKVFFFRGIVTTSIWIEKCIVLCTSHLTAAYCDVTTLGCLQASKHAISRVTFYLQLPNEWLGWKLARDTIKSSLFRFVRRRSLACFSCSWECVIACQLILLLPLLLEWVVWQFFLCFFLDLKWQVTNNNNDDDGNIFCVPFCYEQRYNFWVI